MNQYPHDRLVDERTYLQGLPQSNNVVPDVYVGQHVPPTLSAAIAADIRTRFQNGINKTPLHTAAYNALADNFFQNGLFPDAVFYATNLAAFMVQSQGTPLQEAANTAVQYICLGLLGQILETHPHLKTMGINPQVLNDVTAAYQRLTGMIIPDVEDYVKRCQSGAFQGQGGGGLGGSPHSSPYQGPGLSHHGQSALQQYNRPATPPPSPYQGRGQQAAGPRSVQQAPATTGNGTQVNSGSTQQFERLKMASTTPPASNTQQWSGGIIADTPPVEETPMDPRANELDRDDIPTTPEKIVVDPYYFRPDHLPFDEERPWDVIYVPGGITLVPAHLHPDQAITKSDVSTHPVSMEPQRFCRYHLIWPDGFIQDFPVKWQDGMDYLKHELNDALRDAHLPEKGTYSTASRMTRQTFLAPKTSAEIDTLRQEDIDEKDLVEYPRLLSTIVIASSQLEEEELAMQAMQDEFDLDIADDTLPAVMYLSEQIHPMDVVTECQERLFSLLTSSSLIHCAEGLKSLLQDDLLPLRYYRFLNQRLTQAMNLALKDNLSIDDLSIDNFVEDITELMSVIDENEAYEGVGAILERKYTRVIERAMALRQNASDEEEDEFLVLDQAINYQTGFTMDQLADLKIDGDAQLIQSSTSPSLAKLVSSFVKTVKQDRKLPGRLILISADGIRLEVFAGWLGDNNFMIKRLD